ncbi:MAG: VacJ family lipoprotein [Burkholderiaceae bacterium]|nr:MAG: VacJ family lipoprotein [Burkholderiaceae bacterium]TAM03043.1 MAG: VacJ family lipoprotein [Pusillimonas sp.]
MNLDTPSQKRKRIARYIPVVAAMTLAAGCASVPHHNPNDPLESYNRTMFSFNDTLDRAIFKPVAQGYETVTPKPVRTCVHNIFNNLADAWSSINSFLQGRGHDGINSLGRVLFNSTMGLGGCIDVASMNGSKRIINDFGVTLGVWGFGPGPYIVVPFMGSTTLRDGTAALAGLVANASPYTPVFEIYNIPLRNSIIALSIIDLRASLLSADDLVNSIALDRYSFIRDAYLQRRKALIRGTDASSQEPPPDYSNDDESSHSGGTAAPPGAPATAAPGK